MQEQQKGIAASEEVAAQETDAPTSEVQKGAKNKQSFLQKEEAEGQEEETQEFGRQALLVELQV